jgi:hypothetical protein
MHRCPYALSSRCQSEGEAVPSSSRNCRRGLATPLYLSPCLCSFIATPLSQLHCRTSRPTSYRPVSPASPLSKWSQPWGKSTTSAPAQAPRCLPSSTTASSTSIGHLQLSPPLHDLPEHHRGLGYLSDLSNLADERPSDPSPESYLPPSSPLSRAHTGEPPSVQNPKLGSPLHHLTLAPASATSSPATTGIDSCHRCASGGKFPLFWPWVKKAE